MEENKSYHYLTHSPVPLTDRASFENPSLRYILISSMLSVSLMIVTKVLTGKNGIVLEHLSSLPKWHYI